MMSESEMILEVIGREAMTRLCEVFGGQRLYIPVKVPEPNRDEHIVEVFESELQNGSTTMNSYQRAADIYGLSVRRVQEIIKI
jgi:hypothetical protein